MDGRNGKAIEGTMEARWMIIAVMVSILASCGGNSKSNPFGPTGTVTTIKFTGLTGSSSPSFGALGIAIDADGDAWVSGSGNPNGPSLIRVEPGTDASCSS